MTQKHTPTPWLLDGFDICHHTGPATIHVIAKTSTPVEGDEQANAEFIVRACNAHYDLVEALQTVGLSYELAIQSGAVKDDDGSIGEMVDAALKKAKGE